MSRMDYAKFSKFNKVAIFKVEFEPNTGLVRKDLWEYHLNDWVEKKHYDGDD
jgi:hypothetical protein